MKRDKSHTTLRFFLLLMVGMILLSLNATASSFFTQEDSVRVEEVLLKDTVDLKIHGPSNDVTFYMNGMVFLSNTKFHQKMIPDHITFGVVKAYFVPLEYIALESSRPLFNNDDFPYSPAGMSFTRDYKTVYFTKPVELNGRKNVEKIFEMSIINGEGSNHNQMSFTGDPSRYLHPAISLDDSYMIFSSDRTPSSGGLDLFISRKTPSGWSTPENMGSSINTSGHEWYPYLDHRNNLYFSSSGHMGYGGYDVYVCYFNGTDWDEPQNMTEYINSPEDDLGFSLHPNKKMALFSKVMETESEGEIIKMNLNDKAYLVSGAGDPQDQDITLLLKELIETGYTSGDLVAGTEVTPDADYRVSSRPLLGEEETESSDLPVTAQEPSIAETVPVEVVRVEQQPDERTGRQTEQEPEPERTEPVIEVETTEPVVEAEPEREPETDPNRVVFRVQILSSSKANSNPSVTIAGTRYQTFEYFYKGAYRITVGEFNTVQEASAFRAQCRDSGFSQAFVAAFRGSERETDPAVFRQ